MTARVVWLWLPCCVMLTQCGVVGKVRQLGRGDKPEPPAMDPARRGWGLTMSDEEFKRYQQGGAPGPSPATAGAGGAEPTEASMFDFSSMINNPAMGGAPTMWQRSATVATKQARTSGVPLLIYVTHRSSVPSQQMERTLMASPEFQTLLQEKYVPLLVDYSDGDTAKSDIYRELKERLAVKGYPALIVTLPDGTEVTRLSGYKPDFAKRYLESLQNAIVRADKLTVERRAKLEKQGGYRMWTTKDGRPVLAKLTGLDANMGTFSTEWGESFKTFLTRLSPEDQQWIAERRR